MLLQVLLAVVVGSTSAAANAYATPGVRVKVDGHRLNLVCMGSGRPVVLLDAGLGDWSPSWIPIQSRLASRTTVCAYDRAGYGFSDPAFSPRTAGTNARELHDLLHAANLPAPYVLAAHSYGGLDVLAFAEMYRPDVAGLVLVDGTAPGVAMPAAVKPFMSAQMARAQQCAAAARDKFARSSPTFTACFHSMWGIGSLPNNGVTPRLQAAVERQAREPAPYDAVVLEMSSLTQSQREVQRRERPLGDLPLVVLTATTHGEDQMPPALSASMRRFEPAWRKAHVRLAALSTRGRYELVKSDHYMQFEHPDVVISALRSVVSQIRAP